MRFATRVTRGTVLGFYRAGPGVKGVQPA